MKMILKTFSLVTLLLMCAVPPAVAGTFRIDSNTSLFVSPDEPSPVPFRRTRLRPLVLNPRVIVPNGSSAAPKKHRNRRTTPLATLPKPKVSGQLDGLFLGMLHGDDSTVIEPSGGKEGSNRSHSARKMRPRGIAEHDIVRPMFSHPTMRALQAHREYRGLRLEVKLCKVVVEDLEGALR